jgi:peptidyl-prolyl cis-trans isomerase A (cyclophilin A)
MALSSRIVVVATLSIIAACSPDSPLERPTPEALAVRAPDTVRVRFETSKGSFVVESYRAWSPHGADRFFQLAQMGYYDGVRFFRVLPGFMAQFGLHGSPRVTAAWQDRPIPDDSAGHSNIRGTVSFATGGPNTRTRRRQPVQRLRRGTARRAGPGTGARHSRGKRVPVAKLS